ncbi:MAG TPA: hypothetical protein VGZ04_09175 [Acidimicrobiales bacterium]|nr:hypothetical protein [Acidimicrobiales bacterium]
MARTRAQRRRHTLFITLALAITLIVLVFARDVSRAAHGAATPQRSENRSFAALANTMVTRENSFNGRLETLLARGFTLSRPVFAARLNQLDQELANWITAADQLRRPGLDHRVNETLYKITLTRVAAYQRLLGIVAQTLTLPWNTVPIAVVTDPVATLQATDQQWSVQRFALAKEPGRVHLDMTNSSSASYYAAHGLTALTTASSLALVRAISIAAVHVTPAPLPATAGVLLLPPVGLVMMGVSVVNASYDDQPVTLTIHVTPLNNRGTAFAQTMKTTLGPLGAFAFIPGGIHTVASERARIVLTLTGARAATSKATSETYQMQMSPSGTS